MNIILSILQILGIVLGIVLLLVLILLFHPFFYQAEGEFDKKQWAKGKFSWLFYLVHGSFVYEDGVMNWEISIFGRKKTTKKDTPAQPIQSSQKEETVSQVTSQEEPAMHKTEQTESVQEATVQEESAQEKQNTDKCAGKKFSLFSRIKAAFKTLKDKLRKIKVAYPKIKKILTDKNNQVAVKHLKDEFIYLIKCILPKKSSVRGRFSTGSPDTTGQLFGVLAIFPIIYTDGWAIVPDFEAENACFAGEFWMKGRFYVYQLVGIAIRIILDKNCRRLYARVQSFGDFMKNKSVQEDQ